MANYPKRVVESKGSPVATTDLWLDTNTNPPTLKTFINEEWVVIAGGSSSDDGDDSGDDTSHEITLYQAWMKTFNNFQTDGFPVSPAKVLVGWPNSEFEYLDETTPVYLGFIDDTVYMNYSVGDATLYDLEDIPDNVLLLSENHECTFLYSVDELNVMSDTLSSIELHVPYQYIQYNVSSETVYTQTFTPAGGKVSKYTIGIISIDDKYYVWFQDWD